MLKNLAIILLSFVLPASAIVVEDYGIAEEAPAGIDWSYVYYYRNSSAVAVGGSWLLTAAHVAGSSGSISADGTVYTQQEVVYHPSADLALVRFDQAFPGSYDLYSGSLTNASGPLLEVVLVGYGTKGAVKNFSWTDNGTGRGTKRWGTQEIDRLARHIYLVYDNQGFWMDFDLINTAYEAGTGEGDSGSGVFYNDGGEWKLAGINTERPRIGGDYRTTFSVAVSEYADWIATTVPEPVSTSLLGLGTIGIFFVRARERRRAGCLGKQLLPRVYTCDQFSAVPATGWTFRLVRHHMIEFGHDMKASLHPVINRVETLYRRYDRLFWNYMVVKHERRLVRRQAARMALKQKTLAWLDVCLERLMK